MNGMASVNGTELYYEMTGEGPPVVLIHGGAVSLRIWDDQAAALAESYCALRYDRRGHGLSMRADQPYSPVEDLAGLLDCLEIARPALIGSSLGGGIALDFALTYPDRVRGLALAAPSLGGYEDSEEKRRLMQPLRRAMEAGDAEQAISMLMVNPHFAPLRQHPEARQRLRDMLAQNAHVFSAPFVAPTRLDPPARTRLAEISAPVLVLGAASDDRDNRAIVDLIAKEAPGAQKQIIEGAAHLINLDQPETFNRLVLDFLARLPE